MIDAARTRMFAEAGEAAAAVAHQLDANRETVAGIAAMLRAMVPRTVITLGRGSSDHAATFAKYLIETRLGIPTASAAPSVASLYGAAALAESVLCLTISQSGRSPDLLAAVEAAKRGGAVTLALVNDADSPLAALADHVLPLHAGPELSVAATKSFIASLAALLALVAEWAQDADLASALAGAPEKLAESWQADWSPLVAHLTAARGLYVIGRGLGLGIAQEAALKLKEVCGLHAEAFSAAEIRHGPLALVGPDFPLLVFRQGDETEESVDDLVHDLAGYGAPVFVTGATPTGAVALPAIEADPAIEPMLRIQSFYRAAAALSVARGLDPDRPPHLRKVTETL
jgi:glucosamine--fructose-6-phosphate aminotransferase (isomerizing)